MSKNYYDILGVAKSATPEEIKKAYKKQAIKWHPDRHSSESEAKQKEAATKFKEVGEAYDVLKDPDKKSHYDTYGTMDNFGGGYSAPTDFTDFFRSMFGGDSFFQQERGPAAGETIRIQVPLTIKDLMSAKTVDVSYNINTRCPDCHGTGGTGVETCPHCQGTGRSVVVQRTPFGITQQISVCSHCHGTGKIIKNICPTCNGDGFVKQNKHLAVNIPANIQHGLQLRCTGAGSEAKEANAPNGDLIVFFVYKFDHNRFEIDEKNNIYEDIEIPYYDCILGTPYRHLLPTGEAVMVTIPKCSQIGDKIKIPGKGIHGSDYYLVLDCKLPTYTEANEELHLKQIKNG